MLVIIGIIAVVILGVLYYMYKNLDKTNPGDNQPLIKTDVRGDFLLKYSNMYLKRQNNTFISDTVKPTTEYFSYDGTYLTHRKKTTSLLYDTLYVKLGILGDSLYVDTEFTTTPVFISTNNNIYISNQTLVLGSDIKWGNTAQNFELVPLDIVIK